MSRVVHLIFQGLALLVQYGAEVTNIVPAKYKTYVHLALGLAQAALLWKAHEYNTDGTPQTAAFVKALLIMALCVPLAGAQVTAAFALQPYKAVKASFGSSVVTYSALPCNAVNGPAVDLDFGRIRQAAATKFAPTAAALVAPAINAARNKNKYVKASRFTEIGSGLLTVLQVSKIISLGTTWGTVVATIPGLAHDLQGYFDNQGPPPAETFAGSFLPASGKLHLDPGSCAEYLIQGQYVKGLQSFTVEVK